MKKIISAVAMICLIVMLFSMGAEAAKPYQTYTYSINREPLNSPDAYTPIQTIDSDYMGLKDAIDDPRDLFVDDKLNVYIADAKNNRIVVLDRYYKFKFSISRFINDEGVQDELTAPSGLYVTEDRIFVCDTDANRIVTFDRDGNFLSIILQPEDDIFDDGALYKPVAIAVDKYDRLFIVSSTTYQGIIVMTISGEFIGLVGAQAVSISPIEIIWRRFMTDEMRAQKEEKISTEFNNITIDEDGFIYVTTSSIKDSDVASFLKSSGSDGKYSPVKMLNAEGDEIMRRNGFFPPAGEIQYMSSKSTAKITGPSKIIDVALGPEKTWSIIDEKRSKIFTYDFDGNLLFAFGNKGEMLGNLENIEAIAYKGDEMMVLDKTNDNITIFKRTEYGNILIQALANQNARRYDRAVDDWQEILKRNSNFDAAYIGIGQSLYRSGRYEESLEYYKAAYDTSNYSNSYKEIRKEWIRKFLPLLILIVVAVITAFALFLRFAGKVNKRAATAGGKRTFGEELLYGFHLWMHPFDGFWDLKHEHRGSLRAALVYLVITILAFFYQAIGTGYVSNPQGSYTTIWSQTLSVVVPLLLFAVANWCLTTLFDGEGSFKDIVVAICYSLLPLPIIIIPTTLISNWAITKELSLLNFLVTIAFIWVGILIFFGTMVTHDYSLGKNLITLVGTVAGMAFIMFLGILFSTLLGKFISFVTNIITEITYRM